MIVKADDFPPDFLERLDPEKFSVPELIGLAITERGRPLALEEAAERLAQLGVVRSVPSLRKTWARLPSLRKTSDGKLTVVRERDEFCRWDCVLLKVREELGLRSVLPARAEPESRAVDVESPVRLEELRRGLGGDRPSSLSLRRLLALLAEAAGGEIEVERAVEILTEAGKRVLAQDVRHSASGTPGPVLLTGGRLLLEPRDGSLAAARRLLREHLLELDEREASQRRSEARSREWEEERRAKTEAARRWYAGAKKLVIRCLFDTSGLRAASLLDPGTLEFQDSTDPAEVVARVKQAELILGLDPWQDLERLGVEQGDRTLVDLSPPQKTRQLNRRGRTLKVTPRLIISSTLGLTAPGEPSRLKRYLRDGDIAKLFRRLRSDLKALWRLYEYGCLHRYVHLRWGFLDEWPYVYWNVGELPTLEEICSEAARTQEKLEIVLGSPPGWEEPWSRALRVSILSVERGSIEVEYADTGDEGLLDEAEIFAVRPAPHEPAPHFPWPKGGARVS